MKTIGETLTRDLSKKIEEIIQVDQADEQSVYDEITEHVATDSIRDQYAQLVKAIAEAPAEPHEGTGVWVSGFLGCGKSSFAKNLGYALQNRTICGKPFTTLFKTQIEDQRVAEFLDLINTRFPTEVILFEVAKERDTRKVTERIAELMYTVVLRESGYAEDFDIAELEIEIEDLRATIEEFGKVGRNLLKARKIVAPVWIVVTSQEKLDEVVAAIDSKRVEIAKLQDRFRHRVDLAPSDIREVATKRVLAKRPETVPDLKKLFNDNQGSLNAAVRLERTTRRTEVTEDDFVQFYPYPPHYIDLCIGIMSGIRLQPGAPRHYGGSNRTIIKQAYEMLVSDRTAMASKPIRALVTLDKVYELVEGNLSSEKRTEEGWKLRTAQEKNWETERRGHLEPKPRERNEIHRQILKETFGEPTLKTYRYKDLRTFRVGISVEGTPLGDEGDLPLAVCIADDADDLQRKIPEVRDESRQDSHKNQVYWVCCLTPEIDEAVAQLHASRRMVEKYDQLRAQSKISGEAAQCLQDEKNTALNYQSRLRDKLTEAMERGTGLFRGVARDASALGKALGEILKKLFGHVVPDLYPKLEMGCRPLSGDEPELILKAADLKALPQVFYADENGLGLVIKDGPKFVPNPAADVAKEVLDYLVSEHSYGNKDTRTGKALER
jgi:hypothetical protein